MNPALYTAVMCVSSSLQSCVPQYKHFPTLNEMSRKNTAQHVDRSSGTKAQNVINFQSLCLDQDIQVRCEQQASLWVWLLAGLLYDIIIIPMRPTKAGQTITTMNYIC